MENSTLTAVLQTLEQLEPLFHAAYANATEADFERIVSPDFWEIGASGQIYTRAFALSTLKNRAETPTAEAWRTSDFRVTQAGKNVFLLTYSLQQATRSTRRLTVWQQTTNGWLAMYHQGTVISD